jgi:hypothetical protein
VSTEQLSREKARSRANMTPSFNGSDAANDNLTERTCEVWRPRLGRDLSREDARNIRENVVSFFAILSEWARAEMLVPANDNGKPDQVCDEG